MISKKKMDKAVPFLQGGVVVIYILGYVVYDILHVKRMIRKTRKSIKGS